MTSVLTTQKILALKSTKAPNLPISTTEYSQQYQDQISNALRLYFNQIDSFTQTLSTGAGAIYLGFPYGSFSSTVTQTAGAANTPQHVNLNSTDFSNGVSLNAANDITVQYAGIYNFAFSVQTTNSDTQAHDVDIYFRKNGVPVANSASVFSVVSTHGGQPGYQVAAANFFIKMLPTDYLEMYWSTNSTQVQLNYLPAITTPFISPGAPSVVLTASFVSAM